MSSNNEDTEKAAKRAAVSAAVGKGLEEYFAAVNSAPEGSWVVMDFNPTEGGVRMTKPVTGDAFTGDEYVQSMSEWLAQQHFEEINAAIEEAAPCHHCGQNPCVVESEYSNMMRLGTQMEEARYPKNEIRFALYRYMSSVLHGYLGAGNRKELPRCVVGEIRDGWPKEEDEEYVPYQESSK